MEKVENTSEKHKVDGSDEDEVLDLAADPVRILRVIGSVMRIVPCLGKISER